jgi:hypothetical protein
MIGAGVCFNYNLPPKRDQVLAPYTPGGGGCQKFVEPVLSPLLYNSNLLIVQKEYLKMQRYMKFFI